MPGEHALLSPSSAERWTTCPASVRLAQEIPEDESRYAREGTLAHTLAELRARAELLGDETGAAEAYSLWEEAMADEGLGPEDSAEMDRHAAAYVELLREKLHERPHTVLMLERRVQTGIEGCWGTADAVLVSPEHVEIVDYKYGAGVPVSAVENPQVKLYGVGALDEYGDLLGDVELVRMTIFQPRLDSTSTYDMLPGDLREWRDSLREVADEALNDPAARFGPSEEACRWCPAKGVCKARMESVLVEDFGEDPDVLSDAELAEVYGRLPALKAWIAAVEETALHKAYSEGRELPGWKVVLSNGRRYITDHEAAIKTLVEAGYPRELVARESTATLGDLEKLVGKHDLPDLLGALLAKGDGKPSLVRDRDPRPSIDPDKSAAADFADDID